MKLVFFKKTQIADSELNIEFSRLARQGNKPEVWVWTKLYKIFLPDSVFFFFVGFVFEQGDGVL